MVLPVGEVEVRRLPWLFRKFRVGLRTEIILNLALLMTGALLLVGFGIIRIHERDILDQKIKNGKLIVRSIQNSLQISTMEPKDFPEKGAFFDEVIRAYANPTEVEEIALVDPLGKVMASRPGGFRKGQIDDLAMARAITDRTVLWKLDRKESFLVSGYRDLRFFAPFMKDGVLLGGIYLRLSLADVTKSILTSQRLIIVLVLLDGVIIVFFGSFLLSRVIVKPIKALVRATEGITHGNYDQRITISEENEIGTLADSFNEMTHRLRESQQNVEEYVRSLEITNEQLQQAQIELIRSERLASIGRFAAGVAHEVGNPLGAILGYTSILQTGNDDNPELQDYLKRIEVEIHRINKIIRELLDFSRPSIVEITEVDLNGVIQSCLSLLS
jgi:HAMP domain-containing protein